jgi:hypothetical protein
VGKKRKKIQNKKNKQIGKKTKRKKKYDVRKTTVLSPYLLKY